MNKDKLYNVLFPIWLLILFPSVWLIVIPGNFIIDSLVFIISLFALKLTNKKKLYFKSIFKIFCFGFVADIIGSLLLLGLQFLPDNNWFYDNIVNNIAMNPFKSIWSFFVVIIAIIISGLLIYYFNYKFSFNKSNLLDNKKKKLAFILAIFTAPYFFLIPTTLIYHNNYISPNINNTEIVFNNQN